MPVTQYTILDKKVIIKLRDRICEDSDELLSSDLFRAVVERCITDLVRKESPLLQVFNKKTAITEKDISVFLEFIKYLAKMPMHLVTKIVPDSIVFTNNQELLSDFIEHLYNFWRNYERFIICDSEYEQLDKRPYRVFNATIEALTHLIRGTYRDIEENITGSHPRIYRQVRAGAEIASIALMNKLTFSDPVYQQLNNVSVIRQILLYPPLILHPPMNKRTGKFTRVSENPLTKISLNPGEWLCYPAMVGEMLILVYFQQKYYGLGFSLSNLFELADDEQLKQKPAAVYLYGIPDPELYELSSFPTIFYEDQETDMLVGAVPDKDEFGYFGYLKKMILTLYNIKKIKSGKLPYHGAMVNIRLKNNKSANILVIGDTGAGKSETLEMLRTLGNDIIEDITIIADDMGSLDIDKSGNIIAYGTEIGAFVRLDDLQPGYAFGQIDRTIIMSPNQVNARVVIPVTTHNNITRGFPVNFILYANNYEEPDEEHPVIQRLETMEKALEVFREGTAMSKGTTTSTGLVHTYFVNVFGAVQYKAEHDEIAKKFFAQIFKNSIFVGQMRTRLGIAGWERKGPEESAKQLLELIQQMS
ncbi:MAG TPA: phosphoenolpyruvate carboxykinase [bacterium]|nr:phosphoenolpyruvate carboxykinase [bacterium]HPN42962.1 phosphoenolpyruvate carboxykinase [bacterium]